MKNGPNGRYERRPIRRVEQQHDDDDPAEHEREDDAPERAAAAGEQADADQQLDVAHPERAGPERDRRQVEDRPG